MTYIYNYKYIIRYFRIYEYCASSKQNKFFTNQFFTRISTKHHSTFKERLWTFFIIDINNDRKEKGILLHYFKIGKYSVLMVEQFCRDNIKFI